MHAPHPRRHRGVFGTLTLALLAGLAVAATSAGLANPGPQSPAPRPARQSSATESVAASTPPSESEPRATTRPADFGRMLQQQAETDRRWLDASTGFMQMEKTSYRSLGDDLSIPAFVFRPLQQGAPRSVPALVWVHENIRGHLYEHYVPYIRQAVAMGFVVIAPEYRGSIGYGQALYDAIDYGGAEVDDVVAAVSVLAEHYPEVDPKRIGIIGWSHGGMIALLSVLRNQTMFASAVAIVPVANLFQRLAYKGVEAHRALIDPHNRLGGTPAQRPDVYRARSPLFQIDRLRIPLRVHIADNDQDVNIEEGMQLVDALRSRQSALAETEVFQNPPGGHLFDRRVNPKTLVPEDSPAQRESWTKVWGFLDRTLSPPHPTALATQVTR